MLKSLTKIAAMGAMLLPALAVAQDSKAPTGPFGGNITGSVTLTSDYMYRGVSQTTQTPALQGGLNYDYDTGNAALTPYLGFWASSIKFPARDGESVEVDILPGVKGKLLDDKLTYDVGMTLYRYPGQNEGAAQTAANFKFDEVRAAVGYDFGIVAANVGIAYSWDFFGHSGEGVYTYANATVPLPTIGPVTPKLMGNIGYQSIEKNVMFGAPDYMDYGVGVGANAYGLDFAVSYIGTDIDKRQCFNPGGLGAAGGGRTVCEGRVVFSLTKAF